MSQATDDLLASMAHVFVQLDREKTAYLAKIDAQAQAIATLRTALTDLLTGAEQQSQSHADVAAKCRAALGDGFSNKKGRNDDGCRRQ